MQHLGQYSCDVKNSTVILVSSRLLFGGTIPHYFYMFLERAVPEEASFVIAKKLFLERLIYSPLYQAFTLYIIARLEGKDHKTAVKQLQSLYWVVLTSSWKYLTVIHLLNLSVVPPVVSCTEE